MQHRTEASVPSTRRRAGRRAFAALALGGPALALSAAAPPAQQSGPELDSVRATLEQLVEARALLSQEERDWALGRELLQSRIEAVRREIESRRQATAEARGRTDAVDAELDLLRSENERLAGASAGLLADAQRLEARTARLLAKLPEPALERVRMLAARLPKDPAASEATLSQRFLCIVGILNELNRFHSEVSAFSEVRALPDGTSVEVTALYLGLSKGYYVTASGDAAGTSLVTDAGWTWEPLEGAAAEVARAVAIHADEDVADFVRLPVRVR